MPSRFGITLTYHCIPVSAALQRLDALYGNWRSKASYPESAALSFACMAAAIAIGGRSF
ncbi:MAG: hypothetical protein ACLVJO_05335 [[Clostridium] scindens]